MIEVDHLTKRFGSVTAVDDLTFTVRPGVVTGLLGPNGAGKTTTMGVVLGLQAPTSGRALVGGRPYQELRRPLHQVGALIDAGAVHPGRSARNHLRWVAQSNGIGGGRVDEVLATVGLDDAADRRLSGYSLGMKQRLGIAQALLGDPPVLVFDEPVNGLDPEGIRWARTFLRHLAREGRTILVSSHLMAEMALVADHLVVIGRGRLLADDSLSSLIAQHTRTDVLVRTPTPGPLAELLRQDGGQVTTEDGDLVVGGLDAAAVGALAAAHGITLHQLVTRTATLEDAYLSLTGDSVEFGGAA